MRVNDAIFDAMDAGLVTSATVMANGDALDDAVRRLRDYPQCSFGAHLTLTWGLPVGPAEPLRSFLGDDGRFTRGIWSRSFSRAERQAVSDEWCAQIAKLRALGVELSHFDSHEHVHTIVPLFGCIGEVMRRSGLRRVRLSKNLYCAELPPRSAVIPFAKAAWNGALRHYHGARSTGHFSDAFSVIRAAREGTLPAGTIEAMVHPGDDADPFMVNEMRELFAGALDALPAGTVRVSYAAVPA